MISPAHTGENGPSGGPRKKRVVPSQRRQYAVFQVLKKKRSVSEVAKELGVARKTIYSWLKRYKKAPSRAKQEAFKSAYSKGKKHPRAYRHQIKNLLVREVVKNPGLSATSLSKRLKVGRHAVVNLLSELELSTREERVAFTRLYKVPGRLHSDIKASAVRAVLDGRPVSKVSRENGVARKTVYEWLKRYREEGKVVEKYVSGMAHPKAFSENQQRLVLQIVSKSPELSIHRLAKTLGFSSHGTYNVLKRHGLTYKEARLAYAASQKPISRIPVLSRFLDRVRYVLEQFIPTLAPAPPPSVVTLLKAFGASSFLVFIVFFSFLSWARLLATAPSLSSAIGLIFASMALVMGSFFFLYSFKYYLTLALVLSFSQSESAENIEQRTKGKKGILSWLLGLNGRERAPTLREASRGAVGLTPNLEHISLKRKPYVSVHIPFYNEKNVVRRAIEASTNFDYPEYEVILCDDSTDETTQIIRDYLQKFQNSLPGQRPSKAGGKHPKLQTTKGEGWELTQAEVRPGVTLKHLHRTSRSGFKGGALRLALRVTDPKVEFVSIFDADFVPYPDTLELFLKYFKVQNKMKEDYQGSDVAVVQGYQWHVLNKSENWITKGIRSEYAGSYVIERSGTEIYSGLKMISGAVYMIRRDVLEEVGWETSITEDFQLTLKLYEKGYKVVYTPYIQAPAECVSTLKRLIRQRMRWAEGHSNNIRRMFFRLLLGKWEEDNSQFSINNSQLNLKPKTYNPKPNKVFIPSPLTISEKLEFLYLGPYYLQAFFFLVGTLSWLISETLFPARLPFWTSLWGWSLVLTNMLSLPLMNTVGLFLEESEEKDYGGLPSFIALSYIVVPFQAYAALKGFLEKEEGHWFRTPKTGRITDILKRGTFYRFISGILPGRSPSPNLAHTQVVNRKLSIVNRFTSYELPFTSKYLALATANNQFNDFGIKPNKRKWIGKAVFVFVLISSLLIANMVPLGLLSRNRLSSIENKRAIRNSSQEEGDLVDELRLVPEKTDFRFDEKPKFKLQVGGNLEEKGISFGPSEVRADAESIKTLVLYKGQPADIQTIVTQDSLGDYDISLGDSSNLKPGKYTLQTTVLDDGAVYQSKQDFTWGVLVINTNKSIYLPGEEARFAFAVLDDEGEMVCNAWLKLEIQTPEGRVDELSSDEKTIWVNPECYQKSFTLEPDYEASYWPSEIGTYRLTLTAYTEHGERTITDTVEVRHQVDFDIERFAPTRIYPPEIYQVTLKVKANRDFRGQAVETIPEPFEIIDEANYQLNDSEIAWQVDWEKGGVYQLSYEFKAPAISPQFYFLGPLTIGDFKEIRRWQIAADAIGDIGIWRDSAGSQIPGTGFLPFNFAAEDRNDGDYTFSGSNNLNLDAAGNYLFIATLKFDNATDGRVNYEGRFTYTGSGNFISLNGTGYSRQLADRTAWTRVVGLVWGAGVDDDVQLEMRRDTDTPTGGSIADASHFQAIRLMSSAAVGIYSDSSDTGGYGTQTWTDAPFNTNVLENDTSVIEKQTDDNQDIRLKLDNTTFLIGYGLAFDAGDSLRTQRVTKMVAGTSDIGNSFSYAYMRQTSDQYGAPNGLFLYRNSGTSTDLSVQAQRGNATGDGSAVRRVSTSGMFVVELPASAEVFISHDSTGGQDIGGTNGDFNSMQSVGYYSESSFTYVDDTAVNAEKPMDVLLMGQAFAERSGTSSVRTTTGCRFEVETSDQAVGEHGNFLRGYEAGAGRSPAFNYACFPAGVYAVSSGNDLQFEWFDAGGNGSTDYTVADAVGFSALNLDTLVELPYLNQLHYHWRNDDDNEADATSATSGSEDTVIQGLAKSTTRRIRIEVSNDGSAISSSTQYRLEYGIKSDTCAAIGSWTDVGTGGGGHWDMVASQLVEGNDTTNIAIGTGGVTDGNDDFESPNAAQKESSSQTAGITLSTTEFVEIEYSIEALSAATDGATYCFRLTDAGTLINNYDVYPQVRLAGQVLTQNHYHWRYDDGNEAGATSATVGSEDMIKAAYGKQTPIRLRMEVSNEGEITSASTQYRLEWGVKTNICASISSWVDVDTVSDDWEMVASQLVEGNDTTNIAIGTGGVTDGNDDFESPNAAQKESSSQTAGITLSTTEFVEIEYSIQATATATAGYNYCFRLTNAGTPLDAYDIYAQLTLYLEGVIGEYGTVALYGETTTQVDLDSSYADVIVVASPRYAPVSDIDTAPYPREPRVVAKTNGTSSSFTIKVDSSERTLSSGTETTVDWIAMESGSWTIEDGSTGTQVIAGSVNTDGTFCSGSTVAGTPDVVTFSPTFSSAPAVLSTVASNNSAAWTATHVDDNVATANEPTITTLRLMLNVSHNTCSGSPHAAEDVDYIAFGPGHGTNNGVEFDVTVNGPSTCCSAGGVALTFGTAFADSDPPDVYVISQMGEDGGDGSYAVTHTGTAVTASTHYSGVDEDGPASRAHSGAEEVALVAFDATSGNITADIFYEQAAYRFFYNTDTTAIDTALADQDGAATLTSEGQAFRLRALIKISDNDASQYKGYFKLQYAEKSVECDTAFSGETYYDVTPNSPVAYNDNSPSDGVALTPNVSLDPDVTGSEVAQTYEESNNISNSEASIPTGDSGLWDFALVDNTGDPDHETWCFRILLTDGTQLDTYTVVPEITTVPENGILMLGLTPVLMGMMRRFKRRKRISGH